MSIDRIYDWLTEVFNDQPLPHGIERVAFRSHPGFGHKVVGRKGDTVAWAALVEPFSDDPERSIETYHWLAPAAVAVERLAEYL